MLILLTCYLLFGPLGHASQPFKETPFYSVPVEDMDLSKITVNYVENGGVSFEKKAERTLS